MYIKIPAILTISFTSFTDYRKQRLSNKSYRTSPFRKSQVIYSVQFSIKPNKSFILFNTIKMCKAFKRAGRESNERPDAIRVQKYEVLLSAIMRNSRGSFYKF